MRAPIQPSVSAREHSSSLGAIAISDNQDNAWFPDTGATSHITADAGKLQSLVPYYGPEKIMVGNGDLLDITHVGTASINVGNGLLHLDNVLVVPQIKQNLLSVSQLTSDQPYIFEFSLSGFVIKDRRTQSVITTGSRCGDLYALQPVE